MPFRLVGGGSDMLQIGATVVTAEQRRAVGTVRGSVGGIGIAHLRLKEATQATLGHMSLLCLADDLSEVKLKPILPTWWPADAQEPS
jgi:hypothetical protein